MFGAISEKFRTFDMQINFAIPPISHFRRWLGEFFSLFQSYEISITLSISSLGKSKTFFGISRQSLNKVAFSNNKVTPFVLDMSLLYEHYIYGLLHEAYKDKIVYQFKGKTGYPDFLFKSKDFKAILDTKYIPKYEKGSLDIYVIRQLSGYSRDLPILKHLGYENIEEISSTPAVPCIIIYPEEGSSIYNPFKNMPLSSLCTTYLQRLSMFYKISVPVPTL